VVESEDEARISRGGLPIPNDGSILAQVTEFVRRNKHLRQKNGPSLDYISSITCATRDGYVIGELAELFCAARLIVNAPQPYGHG
jgi:hypothetical protein